jgi:hypothetical protein
MGFLIAQAQKATQAYLALVSSPPVAANVSAQTAPAAFN